MIENQLVWGNDGLREEVKNFFQDLYIVEFNRRPKLNELQLNKLDDDCRQYLEREFSEEEVWEGIKLCDKDKSLGLHRFNFGFHVGVLAIHLG